MKDKELELRAFQYKRMLEERRGHNYQYWTEELEAELKRKGYQWFIDFDGPECDATRIEADAMYVVDEYRVNGYYARIICGRSQNRQRIKMYSVCIKKKP